MIFFLHFFLRNTRKIKNNFRKNYFIEKTYQTPIRIAQLIEFVLKLETQFFPLTILLFHFFFFEKSFQFSWRDGEFVHHGSFHSFVFSILLSAIQCCKISSANAINIQIFFDFTHFSFSWSIHKRSHLNTDTNIKPNCIKHKRSNEPQVIESLCISHRTYQMNWNWIIFRKKNHKKFESFKLPGIKIILFTTNENKTYWSATTMLFFHFNSKIEC